jgi:tetratricopeptide (TPR) repeat protein
MASSHPDIPSRPTGRLARALRTGIALSAGLVLLLPWSARAGSGTRSIFSLGAGARSQGLGGAFVSVADDASALYWNPAGLARLPRSEITASHVSLFSSTSEATFFFAGAAYPTLSAGTFGLGFLRLGSSFDAYDEASRYLGESSYGESQAMLSYGIARRLPYLAGETSFGVSAKLQHQEVEPFSATGTGLDLGFLYRPDRFENLALGANLQDVIGADLKLVSEEEPVPFTLLLGASYGLPIGRSGRLLLSLGYDAPRYDDHELHVGAEYLHSGMLGLRLGFDDGRVTFGVGVAFQSYRLDYAYLDGGEVGSSHPVSFTAGLGPSMEDRRLARSARRREAIEREIARRFHDRLTAREEEARRREDEGDLAGALDAWKIVIEYDPDNDAARRGLERTQETIQRRQETAVESGARKAVISREFEKGLERYSDNDYLLAQARFRSVLEIDPDNEEARRYLERSEAKREEQALYHRERARRLEDEGDPAGALVEWNRVRLYAPEDTVAVASVERLRDELARIETGYRELSEGYRRSERRLEIASLRNRALTAVAAGELEEARGLLERLLELEPGDREAEDLMGRVQRKLTPLSEEEKQKIRELYLAGMKHFTQDEFALAIRSWEEILAIDPDNESIRRNIEEARLRLEGGRNDDASP